MGPALDDLLVEWRSRGWKIITHLCSQLIERNLTFNISFVLILSDVELIYSLNVVMVKVQQKNRNYCTEIVPGLNAITKIAKIRRIREKRCQDSSWRALEHFKILQDFAFNNGHR